MSEELVEHVITQEDLDNNPQFVEEGIKVGDVIQRPAVPEEAEIVPDTVPVDPVIAPEAENAE